VDGFLVIPGVEVTTAKVTCFASEQRCRRRPRLKGRAARDVCALIHEHGGLAIPPHPTICFAPAFASPPRNVTQSMPRRAGIQSLRDHGQAAQFAS